MADGPRCHACCPTCHSHFDTLRAFDAHRVDGRCDFVDERLREYPKGGICKTTDRIGVTVYSLKVPDVA